MMAGTYPSQVFSPGYQVRLGAHSRGRLAARFRRPLSPQRSLEARGSMGPWRGGFLRNGYHRLLPVAPGMQIRRIDSRLRHSLRNR
jgi:hypothetical protein